MSRKSFEVPDQIDPVIGYRMWRLTEKGQLLSLVKDHIWTPGEGQIAQCSSQDTHYGLEPVPECQCGFWALKSIEKCLAYETNDSCKVIGEVELWGRVVEGTDGWRAQYAYPKRIVALVKDENFAEILAQGYNVKVQHIPKEQLVESLNIKLGFISGSVSV